MDFFQTTKILTTMTIPMLKQFLVTNQCRIDGYSYCIVNHLFKAIEQISSTPPHFKLIDKICIVSAKHAGKQGTILQIPRLHIYHVILKPLY